MKILLNGQCKEIGESSSVQKLLSEIENTNNFFAVALNREFVPRKNYEKILLKSMDEVEVVSPHPGG
jgi:thiamine biosynthesis protein ThiS